MSAKSFFSKSFFSKSFFSKSFFSKSFFSLSLFLPALLLAQSCAYFVNTFDQNRLTQEAIAYKQSTKTLYCEGNPPVELVNSSKESQAAFQNFLYQVEAGTTLKLVDKIVLWSLIQMNLRPDLASPTSKLQVLVKNGKSFDYFHYYSKTPGSYPYLSGLQDLLERYKSRHSLLKLANYVDNLYPNSFSVVANFEEFLEKHKVAISKNPVLKGYYMRADETLKENEKIFKYRLSNIVKTYTKARKNISYEVTKSLFDYDSPINPIQAQCNYDMRLYSSSVYLIHKDFIKSHLFGIKTRQGAFLASATQRLESIKPVGKSIFFEGASQTRSAAFCAFNFPEQPQKKLWLVSSDSRDPGQHIYHLMEYGLDSAAGKEGVSDLIGFSRHLFLEDPTRLVFESNRSSKEQLERLLKLNLPVYNARKLGNVWAMLDDKKIEGFVIDERTDGQITCGK